MMIVRWSEMNSIDDRIEEVNRSSFIHSTMIPSILGWSSLSNFEYLFIKRNKKRRKRERELWFSSSVSNRFISMELCTSEWWIDEVFGKKGVVFGGTRRITTCPRGFRACVRDDSRLTKRLLGQSSTEFRRCPILRFDTSSGLLDEKNWFVEWRVSEDRLEIVNNLIFNRIYLDFVRESLDSCLISMQKFNTIPFCWEKFLCEKIIRVEI